MNNMPVNEYINSSIDFDLYKRNRIPLFFCCVLFMLFFFAFQDFGIRYIIGYLAMGVIFAISCKADDGMIGITNYGKAYFMLAAVLTIYIMMPYSRHAYDVIAMVISLDVSMLYVIAARPNTKEVKAAFAAIKIVAALLSFYVFLIAARPAIFHKYISRIITANSARTTTALLAEGYGVAVGGNVVLIDYIILLGLLIVVSTYVIKGHGFKDLIKVAVPSVLYVGAMILENRKSELFVGLMVLALLFISKINYTTFQKHKKHRTLIIVGGMSLAFAFIILIRAGYADRFGVFLNALRSGGNTDISSGRLILWRKAIELIGEEPVIGIGWARFADHVAVYNSIINGTLENVHNNYLQLMCETGVIGFVLVMIPVLHLLFMTIRCSVLLKSLGPEVNDARIANSISYGFQMFNLIVGIIDPSWYKMVFWWFYATSIILSQYAMLIYEESTTRFKKVN